MVDLSKLKNVKFELSDQTKIEAQIAFTFGILIGAVAAGVLILFFTEWQWYFKIFSAIGSIGILGTLTLSLMELFKARKALLETLAYMKKINEEKKDETAI